MLDRLATLADKRARRVLTVAAGLFVVAAALGGSVAKHLDPYGAEDPATESVRADRLLEGAGYREAGVVVLVPDAPVSDRATRRQVEEIEHELRARRDVASVRGYYDTGSRDFVSRDGRSTYVIAALKPTDDKQAQDAGEAIEDELAGRGVIVGGPAVVSAQVNDQVEHDLRKAELLVFPLLFVFSLLFFRSVVAALLPLLIGGAAILGTFLLLRVASELTSISVYALNVTIGLGLGLAIDYSLFIVSRYREEIAKDGAGLAAMRRTLRTAGRTVAFSSLTVATALVSLVVFPQRFLYSMGLGGAIVALLAAAVALTLLPAVLTVLGPRVNALAPGFLQRRADRDARPEAAGFWYRLSRFVMRHPAPVATLSVTALLLLGLPFLGIKFTSPNPQILPSSASARQVDNALGTEFPPFRDNPIRVAVDGANPSAPGKMRHEIRRVSGVASVDAPRRLKGDVSVIEAISDHSYDSDQARDTVRRIRALPAPPGAEVLVTGQAAQFIDLQQSLLDHLPLALAIVITAALTILFLMTGSVVLPVKALLMNVLNLSAVFGILVLIFQDGHFQGLLDYTSQGAIEQTMPLVMLATAFGLSTDYGVFLLSRIKEARDSGSGERESVAIGLERTGRIVTAAALLFAIAIAAFATSQIVFIKQLGVGTALAVLIDATVIRALLVPSLMAMLGRWNWWAPQPLRRLHDRIGLREAEPGTA
jgi:uncharacterized membrane protein YdfJ with MMPL/SSD domain